MNVNLWKNAGLSGSFDAEAATSVMEIKKNAATFPSDRFKRARDELVAIASDGAEHISCQTVRMNTHQSGLLAFEFAAHQRNVLIVIDVAGVSDHAKIAEARRKNRFGHAAHIAFVLHAITNQFRDR